MTSGDPARAKLTVHQCKSKVLSRLLFVVQVRRSRKSRPPPGRHPELDLLPHTQLPNSSARLSLIPFRSYLTADVARNRQAKQAERRAGLRFCAHRLRGRFRTDLNWVHLFIQTAGFWVNPVRHIQTAQVHLQQNKLSRLQDVFEDRKRRRVCVCVYRRAHSQHPDSCSNLRSLFFLLLDDGSCDELPVAAAPPSHSQIFAVRCSQVA